MPETFYQVLDVDPEASAEEIESAYREKVKETHPDVSDEPDAEERFKTVQRAKEVLTDPDERTRYDRLGHQEYLNSHATPGTETGRAGTTTGDGAPGEGTGGADTTTDRSTGGADTTTDRNAGSGTTTDSTAGSTGTGTGETSTGGGQDASATAGRNTATSGGTRSQHWEREGKHPGSQRGSDSDSAGSAYATRNTFRNQTYDSVRVPLTPRSIIQIVAMFVLYPIFLGAAVFPGFPAVVNVFIALCTLFVVGYLMSIPGVALVVFGAWSLLTPLILVGVRDLEIVSLPGIVALVACWFPFGLALLMRSALRS